MSVDADPRTATAIGKVAAVVEALASERRIADIAKATGLAGSTVHRILRELVDLGWARDDGERGYLLGARLLSLAGQASNRNTLSRIAHPILRDLGARTGHTVHFALLSGDEAVYIDKIEGRGSYHMRSRIGLAIPLHCTAIGKAILSALSGEELRATLDRTGTERRTEHTITDRAALVEHLAGVRRARLRGRRRGERAPHTLHRHGRHRPPGAAARRHQPVGAGVRPRPRSGRSARPARRRRRRRGVAGDRRPRRRRQLIGAQSPVNDGGRFSRNAAVPSRMSFVENVPRNPSGLGVEPRPRSRARAWH